MNKQNLSLDNSSPLMKDAFIFGTATSAFQIEGDRYAEGKVDSIWDSFCQQPNTIINGDTGNITCEHYQRWREDIDLMKSLNIQNYRLSIAWPRIISSLDRTINSAGLAFYQTLIDYLLEQGIQPFVTLYHWDLPQYLQNIGGWEVRQTAEEFAFYAGVVSQHFGDKVAAYATFNEPWVTSFLGHIHGIHAPGIKSRKAAYHSAHYQLLAHGLAMPILRQNAPNSQHGIVLNGGPCHAISSAPEDKRAASLAYQEQVELYIAPLLTGQYPPALLEHYQHSLPHNYQEDLQLINQPIDYIGLNYYTRAVVQSVEPKRENCYALFDVVDTNEYPKTAMSWDIYPQGLSELISTLHKDYQLPPVMVMENGAAFIDVLENNRVMDDYRIDYIQRHLNEIEQLILSGVNICGYFVWSFLDNFEWAEGYAKTFGIVHVDFSSQQRTPKASAYAYAGLLKEKSDLSLSRAKVS